MLDVPVWLVALLAAAAMPWLCAALQRLLEAGARARTQALLSRGKPPNNSAADPEP